MSSDQISIRIDRATKAAAEDVFHVLGLSATDAVRMFYRQVALQRGLPFRENPKCPDVGSVQGIGSGWRYENKPERI